jgi:hypothetical protein
MTDWIDHLAAPLKDDEKRKNQQYAVQLRHARLIGDRAPEFFERLNMEVSELAIEIDQKIGWSLGGVHMVVKHDHFKVWNDGKTASVTLEGSVTMETKPATLVLTTTKKRHQPESEEPVKEVFTFQIDEFDGLTAASEKRSFNDPRKMASVIMADGFTSALLGLH